MDKRTVASAHTRIDKLESRHDSHEAVCAERWRETILRIKRIEHIMIGTAASIIMLLVSVLLKT